MKKNLIIWGTVAASVVVLIVTLLFYISKNTSFLNFNIPNSEIEENNQNTQNGNENEEPIQIDLDTLVAQTINVNGPKTLNLPADFKISVYASGFRGARAFDFDLDDNIYLTDKDAGKIYVIDDQDGSKKYEIDANLRNAHGIDWYENDLYVGEEDQVVVYRDITTNGKYSKKEVLIPNLPNGAGHATRTVVVGPDKKLYVSVGSSCNLCEEKDNRRATIVRYSLNGKFEKVYAKGLRNTVGFVFEDSKIWGVDNGRDLLGDNQPPEEVNIIEEDGHYGWPYCYGDKVANPEYSSQAQFCTSSTQAPKYNMQAHSAPLSLAFLHASDESTNFPEMADKNLFVVFHGSWNRTVPTGYKVVRFDGETNSSVNFITGWLESNGNVWGRPVHTAFNSKGVMFISDDKAGVLYKVEYVGATK